MRGKQYSKPREDGLIRITPADAGKTDREGYFFMTEEDHPRRCGENDFVNFGLQFIKGSPPQMRGKRLA